MDFGPAEEVRFCVLLDEGVSRERAESLLQVWNEGEGQNYNLFVRPVSFATHQRKGFTASDIIDDLKQIPLQENCDRNIFFVGRNLGDVLYGLAALAVPLPEALGAVNSETLTHGYVVASLATPGQVLNELFFLSRKDVTIHELYHFLGCEHSYTTMTDCYQQIHTLKTRYRELKNSGYYQQVGEAPFFPAPRLRGNRLGLTRQEVNASLKSRKEIL
jgi:hypothetical protein